MSDNAFKTLLSRTAKLGYLKRVGKGLYAFTKAMSSDGLLLFHAAAHLRSHEFNYLSLETILSNVGVIYKLRAPLKAKDGEFFCGSHTEYFCFYYD